MYIYIYICLCIYVHVCCCIGAVAVEGHGAGWCNVDCIWNFGACVDKTQFESKQKQHRSKKTGSSGGVIRRHRLWLRPHLDPHTHTHTHTHEPCQIIGFGGGPGQNPYRFIGFGGGHCQKSYKII